RMTGRGLREAEGAASGTRRRWLRRGLVRGQPTPMEGLERDSAASRRRLITAAVVAVLLLAGIASALAWRQYDDSRRRAVRDSRGAGAPPGVGSDRSFSGRIGPRGAIGKAPPVVQGDAAEMHAYFRQLDPRRIGLFNGGIAWIDRRGFVRASDRAGPTPGRLADRMYFQRALTTRSPYVSAGLIG